MKEILFQMLQEVFSMNYAVKEYLRMNYSFFSNDLERLPKNRKAKGTTEL